VVQPEEQKDEQRKRSVYIATRDESPGRDESYHSDTDHKSEISTTSDLGEDDNTDEDIAAERNKDGSRFAAKLQVILIFRRFV
jgi:hypothetical protein